MDAAVPRVGRLEMLPYTGTDQFPVPSGKVEMFAVPAAILATAKVLELIFDALWTWVVSAYIVEMSVWSAIDPVISPHAAELAPPPPSVLV